VADADDVFGDEIAPAGRDDTFEHLAEHHGLRQDDERLPGEHCGPRLLPMTAHFEAAYAAIRWLGAKPAAAALTTMAARRHQICWFYVVE
jgi:hypothetical protein